MARSVSASPGAIDSDTAGAPEPDGAKPSRTSAGSAPSRRTGGERATGRDVASAPPRRSAATSPVVVAATGVSRRVLPRERRVRRSAPSKTSARRCVMRRTARPASVRRRRARKRAAVSSGERTAVGSSRMRTSGSVWSAPAMPIRWRVPTGSSSTRASGLPEVEAGRTGEAVDPLPARAGGLEGRERRGRGGRGCRRRSPPRRGGRAAGRGRSRPAAPLAGRRTRPALRDAADLARVGTKEPRGDRDERRLPGAVLSEERVDLSRTDRRCARRRGRGRRRTTS